MLISNQNCLLMSACVCVLGMSQQSDGGFGGAATPQSPLLSPRMGHAQSPMLQQAQGNTSFQSSPEMNGWTQGSINANRCSFTSLMTLALTQNKHQVLV